jgi:hypothetical protein
MQTRIGETQAKRDLKATIKTREKRELGIFIERTKELFVYLKLVVVSILFLI